MHAMRARRAMHEMHEQAGMATILVVDDELGIRALLSEILGDEGHTVELAEDAATARAAREAHAPDLVLLDIWMPDVDGITLLKEWAGSGRLTMPVIMMSGHGTIDTAAEAIRFGASAFLEKPITLPKLLRAVEQALVRLPPAGEARPAARPVSAFDTDDGDDGEDGAAALLPAPPLPASATSAVTLRGDGPNPGGGLYGLPPPPPALATPSEFAGLDSLPSAPLPGGPRSEQSFDLDRPLREARDAFEKSYFEFHLAREGGSMTRVAERTGLERTHLYRKLKQLGVDLSRNKRGAGG
jgi:DNA-binding NtrC family response regulator